MKSLLKIWTLVVLLSPLALPIATFAAAPAPPLTSNQGCTSTPGSYCLLAPLGTLNGNGTTVDVTNLSNYISNMFKAGIAIAAGLAIVMIVIGGIEYMSTDAVSGKSNGRERITSALWGLLIALISYLILQTINPDLLNNNLNADLTANPASITDYPPIAPGQPGGAGGTATNLGGPQQDQVGGLFQNPDGTVTFTSNNVNVDTDGITDPGIDDGRTADGRPQHQSTTSYPGLDATTQAYVVVPTNSGIPLGTQVMITDNTTGLQIPAIVGDHGGSYSEASLYALQQIGAWKPGQGNSASNDNITITYSKKK